MMRNTLLMKIAAVCSSAALGMLGFAAFAQKDMPIENRTDIKDGVLNIVGGIVTAKPGETVQFPVYIENNTARGFAATGFRLFYGEKLKPVLEKDEYEEDRLVMKRGEAGDDVAWSVHDNEELNILGFGSMSTVGEKDNGLMLTVEFAVPADAENGIYPILVDIEKWLDQMTNPIDYAAVNGCIYVSSGEEEYPYATAPTETAPPFVTTDDTEPYLEPDDIDSDTTDVTKSLAEEWGLDERQVGSLVDGKVNIVAGIVKAVPGETVKFPVYIVNNAPNGFAATGIRLIHDDRLTVTLDEDEKPITKKGDAGNDITCTFSYNMEKKIIGLGTMGTDPEKDNGVMYTVEVVVPSDAKDGDKYPMTIEVDKFLDAKTNPIEHVAVNGYIYIADEPISEYTTTAPAVTTTALTATTADTAVSAETTTGTTTTGKGAVAVQTTAKSGGTTSSSAAATKTGDAGVGVAAAGLLLAAGTAAAAARKKKD